MAAPLLAVVAAIEAADLIFAVDSVPAVLAVSDDTFIVYTSNAFAILGLRALHFMPAGLLDRFHYLNKGLAIILAFIGVKLILQASHKMISPGIPEIPSPISLAVIVIVLAGSVVLSLPTAPRTGRATRSGPAGPGAQAPSRPQRHPRTARYPLLPRRRRGARGGHQHPPRHWRRHPAQLPHRPRLGGRAVLGRRAGHRMGRAAL
ncbi:hypothetical protein GCM10010269_76420 [Streptomyces humidus]|uniref:TerC family protein n=1 Tax=Streptomyces humidus TaxID=52259 RepID=A0A918GAH1_9ACTN|nr:hypothetical protein GCM10010269_76420 [Streptomyces humidus]